ncbi:MAG: ABC transporter permease [Burkholderiales bacterium]|nr:ABC transporter permease [Burkholderiales bacterium]
MSRAPGAVVRRQRPLPSIVAITALFAVAASLAVPGFTTGPNLTNVGQQTAILLMLSMPMTLVIMSEGLDLSAGALLSLCGVVLAKLLVAGSGLPLALLASVAVGFAFGIFNGVLVSVLTLPPFVVTLGTLGIAQGAALVVTDGNAVTGIGPAAASFYALAPLAIPISLVIALAMWAITHVLLYHTRFGNGVFAIGGNRDALVLAGAPAHRYHIGVYAIMGAVVGITALLLVGRMNSGHPTVAIGMEFDAIAAVVLGGTAFERGDGRLYGTVFGVATIGIVRNALNLLGIESSMQVVSIGVLVLLVILLDSWRKEKGRAAP